MSSGTLPLGRTLPPARRRRAARDASAARLSPGRIALLVGSLAAALLPWTLWLLRSLPARHATPHWNIAWAGFDLLLAAALATTALAGWRRSPWLQGSAVATGTLLLVDSWFDLATARPGGERVLALAEAVLAELPLAALCFWIAATAARRAGQARRPQAEQAGEKA